MKVLFITLVDFKSIGDRNLYSDLLREFVKHGHEVTVVSPFERNGRLKTHVIKDEYGTVIKVEIDPYQKSNVFKKGISIITVSRRINRALSQHLKNQSIDLVLYSTPPITIVHTVEFIKRKFHAHSYLLLKDIFPQNAVDMEMIRAKGFIHNYFRELEKELYAVSDFIGCMSTANVDYLLSNNPKIKSSKVEVCPNSIEPFSKPNLSLKRSDFDLPEDKVIFVYGGNLGKPQGIDFLVKTLDIVQRNEWAYFLIIGSGTESKRIEEYIQQKKPNNVRYLSTLPSEKYDQVLRLCDVGLIYLDFRFTIPNFPSRLLSYMNASLPIMAVTDWATDIRTVIESNGFGVWTPSDDLVMFEECLHRFFDRSTREKMGQASNQYFLCEYTTAKSYQTIMSHWEGEKHV